MNFTCTQLLISFGLRPLWVNNIFVWSNFGAWPLIVIAFCYLSALGTGDIRASLTMRFLFNLTWFVDKSAQGAVYNSGHNIYIICSNFWWGHSHIFCLYSIIVRNVWETDAQSIFLFDILLFLTNVGYNSHLVLVSSTCEKRYINELDFSCIFEISSFAEVRWVFFARKRLRAYTKSYLSSVYFTQNSKKTRVWFIKTLIHARLVYMYWMLLRTQQNKNIIRDLHLSAI